MNQPSLFSPTAPAITFADTQLPESAKPRLGKQCAAILERLMRGPATNRELAELSLKYTGRISDLRKSGYTIILDRHDTATGFATYRLENAANV